MTRSVPYFQVDAFTKQLFGGNPAAVLCLGSPLPDAVMLQIASENNLSETAFCAREGDGFRLRWFTPTVEVDLCGHATLATGFVLLSNLLTEASWALGHRQKVAFETRSGVLSVWRDGEQFGLELPTLNARGAQPPAGLVAGLGGSPEAWLKAKAWLAVFAHRDQVRDLRPDFSTLKAYENVIATAPGWADGLASGCDYVSRYFAPLHGINEDPVTGSAHATLAPYWSDRLGRARLSARQISARGGDLETEVLGDKVILRGHAVLVKSGSFILG